MERENGLKCTVKYVGGKFDVCKRVRIERIVRVIETRSIREVLNRNWRPLPHYFTHLPTRLCAANCQKLRVLKRSLEEREKHFAKLS